MNEKEQVWISYGTASFEYVIDKINKEVHSEWLNSLLKKQTFLNK